MELGGKSPVLIFEDTDIERAGRRAVHLLYTRFNTAANAAPPGRASFIQQAFTLSS